MTKLYVVVLLLAFGFILSCNQFDKKEEVKSEKETCDINPNGSSELSKLMRFMIADLEVARKQVVEKKQIGSYPSEFEKIFTAVPSDDKTKDEAFDPMATMYLNAVKSFYSSNTDSAGIKYNMVISNCENCHKHYCPGPLVKIRKLYLPEDSI